MIKVGDLVRVLPRKKGWKYSPPAYVDNMLEFVGKELKVKNVIYMSYVNSIELILEGAGNYKWDSEWVVKVDKDVSLYE